MSLCSCIRIPSSVITSDILLISFWFSSQILTLSSMRPIGQASKHVLTCLGTFAGIWTNVWDPSPFWILKSIWTPQVHCRQIFTKRPSTFICTYCPIRVLRSLINRFAYWAFTLCMQNTQRDVYLSRCFERFLVRGHSSTLLTWLF